MPRTLTARLKRAGFQVEATSVIPIINTQFRENTYGWGLIELIKSFVPGRGGISVADVEKWTADLRSLDAIGEYFLSICGYVFLASKK